MKLVSRTKHSALNTMYGGIRQAEHAAGRMPARHENGVITCLE
jgi:hypothetical protein